MSGAAILCGSAALRGGAGLVFVAVPEAVWSVVAGANPCYLTVPLPDNSAEARQLVLEECGKASVVVVGPGLSQGETARDLVGAVLRLEGLPLVLDADGLNLVAAGLPRSNGLGERRPVVITPHPGEFARLIGSDVAHVQAQREALAADYARREQVTVVLKGADTVVTDGRKLYINPTGNPGMATGGTGDVLAGLIGALLGQKLDGFDAAVLGTYLHGLAGDLARNTLGEVSLIAADLLDHLPAAFVVHQRG
jgi:NAD(P)H-hydrate epimerase